MPYITRYENIFRDPSHEHVANGGMTLSSLLPHENSIVELNGTRVGQEDYDRPVGEDDELVIVEVPADPITTFFASLSTMEIIGGLILVTSLALQLTGVLNKKKLRRSGQQLEDQRRFTGVQTSVGANSSIPVIFGEVRAGGHIIETYHSPDFSFHSHKTSVAAVDYDQLTSFSSNRTASAIGSESLNTRIALCWGPVERISDIQIDENPIKNINGIGVETALGVNDQGILAGFSDRRNTKDVQELVKYGFPITQRTTQEVSAVEVNIAFNAGLFAIDKRGGYINRTVKVKLEIKVASEDESDFEHIGTFSVRAHSSSPLDFWFRIPRDVVEVYDIRVTRVSEDSTAPADSDEFQWESVIEEQFGDRSHPGIAQMGFIQVPQAQSAVPKNYTALVRGLNDIRIYSSPNVYTTGWSHNPAWCFLRWITDKDFGLGKYVSYDKNIDIQSFIDWGEHCDEMVDSGVDGVMEARCRIDWEMSQSMSVSAILEVFATAGDADLIEQGGMWSVVIHRDQPVKKLLSPGSYKKDTLSVNFLSSQDRTPVLSGSFINKERGYKEDSITAIDSDLDVNFQSQVPEDITFRGVTRASQVKRSLAKAVKFSRISNELAKLTVGLSALDLKAGDVVRLSSVTGRHGIAGGRLVGVSGDQRSLELDQEVDLDESKSYEIYVQHGSSVQSLPLSVPETKTTNVIDVQSASWLERPVPGIVYGVGEASSSTALFRITKRILKPDYTSDIEMHKYEPGMFNVDNFQMDNSPSRISVPDHGKPPGPVRDLQILTSANLFHYTGGQGYDGGEYWVYAWSISVSWRPPKEGTPMGYSVLFRWTPVEDDQDDADGNDYTDSDIAPYEEVVFTRGNEAIIGRNTLNIPTGVSPSGSPHDSVGYGKPFEVKVVSVSYEGKTSNVPADETDTTVVVGRLEDLAATSRWQAANYNDERGRLH